MLGKIAVGSKLSGSIHHSYSEGSEMATDFIVHDKADTVGVVVTEEVQPGKDLTGWVMETDETIKLRALDAVPLGHKIALNDIKTGDTVLKYGHDIGRAVADVGKGRHVHTNNLKTKRW
jgi:(2R)-sulfolactate sulfo-lyase subunit alpha